MCRDDDIVKERYCGFCRQNYYGPLGHEPCPVFVEDGPTEGKESISIVESMTPEIGDAWPKSKLEEKIKDSK